MKDTRTSGQLVRHIPAEGTYNLRDVGGYRADGGAVKWRTIFRSDALHRLTASGKRTIVDLGVGRVIDLRDRREITAFPDTLPESIEYVHHPIFPSAHENVLRGLNVDRLTELIYLEHADTLAQAISHMARHEAPTIVHCTAGKDRTGAVITLTLASIGVDRDDILEDYAVTEEYLRGEWTDHHLDALRRRGIDITDELLSLIAHSPLPTIDRALTTVEREYGSVHDYLRTHGVSEATLEELNTRFVS